MQASSVHHSDKAPEPVGLYPHARRAGNLLFLSGVGPRKKGAKDIPGVVLDEQRNVVSYDIADPKRLRKVFTVMRGFGDHLQLSVFRADLSPKERIQLVMKLASIINHKEDQVLIIPVGPAGGELEQDIEALGRSYAPSERGAVVV